MYRSTNGNDVADSSTTIASAGSSDASVCIRYAWPIGARWASPSAAAFARAISSPRPRPSLSRRSAAAFRAASVRSAPSARVSAASVSRGSATMPRLTG